MPQYVVTGCLGFIGSNIVRCLLAEPDNRVLGLDNGACGSLDYIADFSGHSQWSFIRGDIRNAEVCRVACKSADFVLHQAALGSVPESFDSPVLYSENNEIGTLNMMRAALEANVRRFVYASSASVYGDGPLLPKIETMVPNPKSPYALSKITCEYYGKIMFETYGLPTVGLRYFNVYGPCQNPRSQYAAVIPKFATAYLENEPPTIFGDGEQTRDFVYVSDVVNANLKACNAPPSVFGRSFNIGSGDRVTLNELSRTLAELTGASAVPRYERGRIGDIRDSVADVEAARQLLEFHVEVSLKQGLQNTLEWYRSNK